MEIKKNELLFSVIILLVMVLIGLSIGDKLSQHYTQVTERYAKAAMIDDPEQFLYGMETSFGDALIYGTVTTDTPVTFDEIGGGYIYIEKNHERYTKHTRTITRQDANGHTRRETEVYYTWDKVGSVGIATDTIRFCGFEFGFRAFEMQSERLNLNEIGVKNRGNYIYESSNSRYYYRAIPVEMTGTVLANLQDNTIKDTSQFYKDQTPEAVLETVNKTARLRQIFFWILWMMITGSTIYLFLYFDNRWLDER